MDPLPTKYTLTYTHQKPAQDLGNPSADRAHDLDQLLDCTDESEIYRGEASNPRPQPIEIDWLLVVLFHPLCHVPNHFLKT